MSERIWTIVWTIDPSPSGVAVVSIEKEPTKRDVKYSAATWTSAPVASPQAIRKRFQATPLVSNPSYLYLGLIFPTSCITHSTPLTFLAPGMSSPGLMIDMAEAEPPLPQEYVPRSAEKVLSETRVSYITCADVASCCVTGPYSLF